MEEIQKKLDLSQLSDDSFSDTDTEISEGCTPDGSHTGRCSCISNSAKTYRNVTKTVENYLHDKVEQVIHLSHSDEGSAELNLSRRHLGAESCLPIAACLQSHPMISLVDLSYNSLKEKGGIDISLAVIGNPYITTLILAGNGFGQTKAVAYLSVLLSSNNVLLKLDLSSNQLTDKDALLLAGGIMENIYLRELLLSTNLIEEKGAGYLGRALAINNSLDKIDLSANCIRADGAVFIGKAIGANFVTTWVDLSGNGLGYNGALAVRECLLRNTVLKTLNISNNRINWEGALAIAHGLEYNTTLEILIAGDNPLTTTGCMDIIDAISSNCSLKHLDLKNVNVVKEFRQLVRMIKDKNPDFTVVFGHVVLRHDVLGFRNARTPHPMYNVVRYLIDRELRPVELLRMMDKTVSFKMNKKEFLHRCDSVGINIKNYEKEEFMRYILAESSDGCISYSALLASIEKFIEQERDYRLSERRKYQALTQYQRYLLDRHLPQVSVHAELNRLTNNLLDEVNDNPPHDVSSKRLANSVKKLRNSRSISSIPLNKWNV